MSSPIYPFESFQTNRMSCLAIGNFDGVHYAHQKLLREMVTSAQQHSWESYVLTFEPHPRKVIQTTPQFHLLQSYEKKYETLIGTGIDGVIVANFTKEFSSTCPVHFLEILCTKIPLKSVYIGFNFRFGKGAIGTPLAMRSFLEPKNILCHIFEPIELDGLKISSAFLRNEIASGHIDSYWRYTGRPYCVEEKVITGSDRGNKIGYATANLQSVNPLLKHGVYIAQTTLADSSVHRSLVHVGPNPTFDDPKIKTEVHIPGFAGNLYGQFLKVEFMKYLREIQIFENVKALQGRISQDINSMGDYFKNRGIL